MSRTLNDDFDEDDLPTGPLDLEQGGGQVGTGAASSYSGGDGIDFDDELYGDDAGGGGALELDLPNQQHGVSTSRAPNALGAPSRAPSGPMDVPDLALSAAQAKSSSRGMPQAPPAPRSSGSLPAVRTSGMHPAAGQSGQPSGAPQPQPSSGRALQTMHAPDAAASEGGHHGFAPPAPSSSRGVEDPSGPQSAPPAPLPPAKPTAAAVIAKYPSPPTKIGQAPMYAVRVILRQLELRTDLESLRRRRSPDVVLYEAALRAYDKKTFRLGMAINCAALAVATFVFFLPVIIRFVRAD